MSAALTALIARCRILCRPRSQAPDAELLRRFTQQHDAAAFEELLERHAALVWGVCRRILPNQADCEDAFQATFLALVRRAGAVEVGASLGAWLHTVAVRVARKTLARSRRQRQQTFVPEPATVGDVADEVGSRELFRMVDEEIEGLPTAVRAPLILCCLEGRTRDEAAAELGCSVAAVKSRLERGRELLRHRLNKRGVQLPVAFLVLGLTGGHVQASLRAKALQCIFGSAPAAVAALVPAAGVSLASKMTLAAMSLMVAGALGFGAFRIMQAEPPKEAPAPAKDIAPKSSQPAVAEKPPPRLDRHGDPLPLGAVRRFGTLRFRHSGIYNLAFTPDGKQLLAGRGTEPLAVFDARTGRKLRTVGKSSANNFGFFALSPDGKHVACCGKDVFVWDLETGRLIRELGCGRCQSVAFSPDGEKVAVVPEWRAEIVVVDVATGKHLAKWAVKKGWVNNFNIGQYHLFSLAYSPDGKYLAGKVSEIRLDRANPFSFSPVSIQVCVLDAVTGKLERTFGLVDDSIHAFAFQPGTGRLAVAGKDGALRFWDVEAGKELHHLPAMKGRSYVPRFAADGRRCLALNNKAGYLSVLDAQDGREIRRLGIDVPIHPSVNALSPDGRVVAATKSIIGDRVHVWDVESGAERLGDAGHDREPILSVSADSRTLISWEPNLSVSADGRTLTSEDATVLHWDLRTGLSRSQTAAIEKVADRISEFSANGTARLRNCLLKINRESQEVEVRSLEGSRLLRKLKMPPTIRDFVLSPDGTHVAVALQDRNNTVFLWDPEKEERPRTLTGHPDACQKLLFSHDGKRLIAGAGTHNAYSSSTVWIWDVATARIVHKLATNSAPGHLLLTADDRILLTGGLWNDAAVHAWDMETGKELACLADPSLKHTSEEQGAPSQLAIAGLVLSADERFLAIASNRCDTSAASIWETGSWKPIRAFSPTQPRNHSTSMIFSRDGRSLFVSNSDTTILEWDVSGRTANGQRQLAGKIPYRDRLNVLWQTLIETPDKAYPAVWEMLDHPAQSVPYLIDKVSPAKPVEENRVRQLLARLDSESFVERENASRQLLALGEQIVPRLHRTLNDKPPLEMKMRIEGVIESLKRSPTPDQLRLLRALAVLEWSSRSEADEHLRRLAGGDPSASLTRTAKAAWQRRQEKSMGRLPSLEKE